MNDELQARVDRLEKLLASKSIDANYLQCLLRQSTELLKLLNGDYEDGGRKPYWERANNQIAANEAVLGGR